jgi:ferrochelatase
MRYWHPFVEEIVGEIKNYAPEEIILLPLYPQFSTTTTESSLKSWRIAAKKAGLNILTKTICCYPEQAGFITALAAKIRTAYVEAQKFGTPRLLFSAHGLPEKIVAAGDPYPMHCQRTVEALRRTLAIDGLDSVLCYQSRVGPLKWITPSTDDEIKRAAAGKKPIVIAPIAFVSEHSETLVEIDMEYRHLALEHGAPHFATTGTVANDTVFIEGLADLVRAAQNGNAPCLSGSGARLCATGICSCPMGKQ